MNKVRNVVNNVNRKGKKMKEIREKKDKISGITLIALVITIVILIILAGISANLTLGENGILTKTKEAKIMSAIGSITDQIHLFKKRLIT